MEDKPKHKATRRIKKFDFSDENSTVSLVGEDVGGPANGYFTLLTKSKKNVSEEFLRKASEVTVTMPITEYLNRFYGVWGSDAEVLVRALGFVTPEMDQEGVTEYNENWYEDWITERVASIKVMKQLHTSENIEDTLMNLTEDEYLQFLQDQEVIEKALLSISSESVGNTAEDEASTIASVEKSGGVSSPVVKQKKKGNIDMTKEVQTVEQTVEVIAKAQFDEIQKAFDAQKEELQKALDLVNQFKQEKKEAIAKARKEKLQEVVGDKSEVIFKACGDVEDSLFVEVLKALGEMKAQIEKSKMFDEVGVAVEDEQEQEAPITRLIKQKYNK